MAFTLELTMLVIASSLVLIGFLLATAAIVVNGVASKMVKERQAKEIK